MSKTTEKRKTSEELKAEITEATEKMKEAVKDGTLPLTNAVVNEINASESTPDVKPTTESKPEPTKAAEGATGQSVDLKEWAKSKGYNETDESVLAVLRKADQVYHERRQKEKEELAKRNVVQPPVYSPPPMYSNGYQPVYQPPQSQDQILAQLAKENDMTIEDFRRVAKVSREVYEAAAQADRARWQAEIAEVKLNEQKNSVFRELSSDPVFRRPDVAFEFHHVLEQMQASDPDSFEKDPIQYKRAFDRALNNIGRRYLEGKPLTEGVPPPIGTTIPSMPPRPIGQGSGGGYAENENSIDIKEWNKLDPKAKRKWFEERGLIGNY